MDFHTLTRKELQSLCKLNKIPANITNVAMADALQSLPIVVGIEEFLNASQSEASDLVEVLSPKAPQTRCRTTARPKAKTSETETPAVSRTCRKAPATSIRRNVSYQLNDESEKEAKEEGHKYSTRRSTRLMEKKSTAKKGSEKAVKIGSFIDLTEKEDGEDHVELTANSNAEVEDICNAFDELVVEEEATKKSGEYNDEVNNLKKELNETTQSCEEEHLEDKLETSEVEIDQVCEVKSESIGMLSPCEEATQEIGEKDEGFDEVNSLKQELDETTMSCEDNLETSEVKIDEVKPESDVEKDEDCDEVSSNLKPETAVSCEVEDLEDNLKTSAVENDLKLDSENITLPCEDDNLVSEDALKEHNEVMVDEDTSDCKLESDVDAELGHEDTHCPDSEINNQLPVSNDSATMLVDVINNPIDEATIEEAAYDNTVEDVDDVIPTADNLSIMTEEVDDFVDVISNVDNHSTTTEEVEAHVDVIPTVDNHSAITVGAEENNVNEKCDADCGPNEKPFIVVSDNKENIVDQGKHKKKEKAEMVEIKSNEISMRQLKRQLKALTLKNDNSKVSVMDQEDTTTRPALQTL